MRSPQAECRRRADICGRILPPLSEPPFRKRLITDNVRRRAVRHDKLCSMTRGPEVILRFAPLSRGKQELQRPMSAVHDSTSTVYHTMPTECHHVWIHSHNRATKFMRPSRVTGSMPVRRRNQHMNQKQGGQMTTGKKAAIALAVAVPLLVLGAGIALAADDIPGLKSGDGATLPSFGASNNAEVASAPADCDGCIGNCTSGTGECDGSGGCASGTGQCKGSGDCASGTGECDGSGGCISGSGVCDGPGSCGGGRNCSSAAAATTPGSGGCGGCTR
jgi:hypothetical protein